MPQSIRQSGTWCALLLQKDMLDAGHIIVGTAGHIDHGKTSLVRALTGVNLDSLPEERDRGITITLGFTHLTLSSQRVVSFIDVPGHERLIRTMIAGATGLDAVMLCVSAVEGVMPQTREHLSILELLGVRRGLVVLTMTDLVDEEMMELAMMDAEESVEGTFLEGAPIIPTAALADPPQGLDALQEALAALPLKTHSATGLFRLPIDRAFVQRGFGAVVTGTARSGSIRDGEEVEVQPAGLRARVRGVQVHGHSVSTAHAGQRTALNLAGIERDDLARGMAVVRPGTMPPASILDASYTHLEDAVPIPHGARVRLLAGTTEVIGVLSVLDDDDGLQPGEQHLIQIRTDRPIIMLPGDRFILRRISPLETLGGGVVLDPWSRRLRRKHHLQAIESLSLLEAGDRSIHLLRSEGGLSSDAALRYGIAEESAIVVGGRWLHPQTVGELESALMAMVATWHRENPLVGGAPRRDLRRGIFSRLPESLFVGLLSRLSDSGQLVLEGPRLRAASFSVRLTPQQQVQQDALELRIRTAGLEGPKTSEVLQSSAELLHLLLEAGTVSRVGPYLMHRESLHNVRASVKDWLKEHGALLTADFKQMTALSRKYAIPLLEWLDASGVTRRIGDRRIAH